MKPKGLEAMRTAVAAANPRSIPARQRSSQIALYLLRKEKERYQQELARLDKRREYLTAQLARIDGEIGQMLLQWQDEIAQVASQTLQSTPTGEKFEVKKLRY